MVRLAAMLGLAMILLGTVSSARASWQGQDGPIVFVSTRDGTLDDDDTGEAELYSMQPDGTGQTRLTMSAGDDIDPSWSADGDAIVFVSNRTGDFDLYTMDPDGSNQTQLNSDPGAELNPSFSPGGDKIVFVTARDGSSEIYVYDGNGDTQTRLTNHSSEDHSPVWSPNGTKIAFVSARDGDEEIYTMNPNGTGLTQLTSNTTPDYSPEWRPDSSKILFISERDGVRPSPGDPVAGEIYVMDANGTNGLRMTNDGEYEYNPVFSNDGSEIAFTRSTLTERDEVHWMQNSAGAVRWNLSQSAAQDFSPDYRPLP